MIKIEKNISLPLPKSRYPFSELETGDSFFIPLVSINNINSHKQNFFRRRREMKDRKFICRAVEGGVRVWRTE